MRADIGKILSLFFRTRKYNEPPLCQEHVSFVTHDGTQ
jgi:hypothetical protein